MSISSLRSNAATVAVLEGVARKCSLGCGLIWLFLVLLPSVAAFAAAPPSSSSDAASHFTLVSPAFAPGAQLPEKFTCEGANFSPPLRWTGAPAGVRSFALTLDDPDAPSGDWVHWVIYNLPAATAALPAHIPGSATLPDGARQGANSFQRLGYDGPCPPPGRPHHYIFRLYALDHMLRLPPGVTAAELYHAMSGHILGSTETSGLFSRQARAAAVRP